MADFTLSTNMNLPVPIVGQDPGPDYAFNVNNCLTILDGHNHTIGSGVKITPDGLNISSDLTFLDNNALALRSVRFQSQLSPISLPADLNAAYVSGVDLYYNDGNGNQIRITNGGSIAGTNGSITGLVPPASATFSVGSETFIFQSAVNKPGNIDAGFIILRNNVVNSKGLTLQPPAAMAADYTITLPVLPAATGLLTIDPSGNIAVQKYGDYQISSSSGSFTTSAATYLDVTNLSVTITTTGRPVFIGLISDASGSAGGLGVYNLAGGGTTDGRFRIVNGAASTTYAEYILYAQNSGSLVISLVPSSSLSTLIALSAGTYTFKVQALNTAGVANLNTTVSASKLVAYET